jgi:predicted kinase
VTLVVGVTGGIGSGKTTVTRLFEQRGAGVVDTDEIARALTAPGGRRSRRSARASARAIWTPMAGSTAARCAPWPFGIPPRDAIWKPFSTR